MGLSDLSIRRPVTTTMFFVALGILGVISLDRLPVELLPEIVFPEIYVTLNLRGASPEQVERDLVMPVEAEVGKLSGVIEISSSASANRGNVRASYSPGTDMKFAELQVQSRIARLLPNLPDRAQANIRRFDAFDLSAIIMQIQVLGEGDINWIRDFTEEKIRPELEAVDGVVDASVLGGQQGAVTIIVDPLLLQAHRVSMGQVNSALRSFNRPRTYLGEAYDGSRVYPVSYQGQFSDMQQIQEVVIKPNVPLRLGDIATVDYGLQKRLDLSRVNGKSSIGIIIQKEDEANLITVSREVEAVVADLNRTYAPEGIELLVTTSQAELMEEALGVLKQAAVIGLLLGLTVLFLFLRNVRFVSVLLLAIPTSLLLTFNLMYVWGLSLNVLSLCGLALAMGMLTDNSIVVMESIFKQFERGKPPASAARDGAAEVSRAVVAATATTVTVFLPVAFIQSDYQDILQELALSIAFPLLASLLVALTLVPAVAARTLSSTLPRPLGTGRLMEAYTLVLKAGLRHRARVTVGIGVALLGTLILSFYLMLQQQAVQEETRFTVYADLGEGATLDATDQVVRKIEDAVREVSEVERFTTSVREGQGSVTAMLFDRSERPDGRAVDEIKDDLDEKLRGIPGGLVGFDPPTSSVGGRAGGARGGGGRGGRGRSRTGGFNLQAGTPSEQAVIRGHDFTVLQTIADNLTYRLEELEEINANTVRADAQRSASEVQVIPDAAAMFDRGLRVRSILTAIEEANPEGSQTQVSFVKSDGTEIPIEVRTTEDPEEQGPSLEELRQIPVLASQNKYTPLEEVARVRVSEGRRNILRTDQSRRVVVSYQFTSDVLDSQQRLDAAREATQMLIQDMVLPGGYAIETVEAETETVYYWMMGIAAILIYMILASLFESVASPIIIFGTLPAAVVGSCWALMLSGTGLTSQAGPMALLGFIVLLGIAVNNGIILIDAIRTLRTDHGFRRERAVLAAGRSRVRPILMTSATTLLGVLPLALEFGGDYEIWPPFAITVLGGLSVSMISTLIFVPVVYMGLDQTAAWLKDIGRVGLGMATLATAGLVYAIHVRYENLFWTSISLLPIWFTFLTGIWSCLKVHRSRMAARSTTEVRSVRLQNLTKTYGAPGRFRREWARFDRRTDRMLARGVDPTDRKGVIDGLTWKLPLLGLIAFLHTYLEEALWIYLLALATWGLLADLRSDITALWAPRIRMPRWIGGAARFARKHGLPVLFLGYTQWRLGLLSVTIGGAALWLTILLARFLADRIRVGRIDIERIRGRLGWAKRALYGSAAAIPLIGVPRPPFQALGGVDIEIGRGMFGLLGPNGAGKTTLMRIVCQVLEPSFGSVAINGTNIHRGGRAQGLIGYLPQHFGLYDHLSAYQFLDHRALLEGLWDRKERKGRILACLDQVNLLDRQKDPIGSFSGGMRQRMGIAQTLLHMPQIIVVDEPTAGLDPVERIRFRNLLARVSQERIVIFSTHIVEDISGSCNHLAVLNQGRVLYSGTPQSMRGLAHDKVWEAVVPEETFTQVERDLSLITHVRTKSGVRARFLANEPSRDLEAHVVDPTLEDAYLFLLRSERESIC